MDKRKRIGWIEISYKKYGGITYNESARKILGNFFDVELILKEAKTFKNIRWLKIPESLFLLTQMRGEKDLWVRDFFSTITLDRRKTKGKNMAVIHHIDSVIFPPPFKIFFWLLEIIFYWKLKKVDFIVVVSEYWRQHFLKRGYKNVYKIYNSFDLSEFDISEKEVLDFKHKYNLQNKPIIYLGNCQKAKGVVESYESLKDLNVHLVTSGQPQVKIPALNLNLNHREYLVLLKASAIALAMSEFKEGWCRTAHEALLCKTPVIGSGSGGMKELLEGGGQMICQNFNGLKEKAEYLLSHPEARKKMGEDGYNFAKSFTQEKFKQEWINLIKNI